MAHQKPTIGNATHQAMAIGALQPIIAAAGHAGQPVAEGRTEDVDEHQVQDDRHRGQDLSRSRPGCADEFRAPEAS
jgi:hypothetical protein